MKRIMMSVAAALAMIGTSVAQAADTLSFDIESERDKRIAASYWKTEKGAVMDNSVFLNALVDASAKEAPLSEDEKSKQQAQVQDDILELLLAELKDERGVHVETALSTIGALAGFSVQMTIREFMIEPGLVPENEAFTIVETKNGETYFFGELLNEGLAMNKPGNFSVWAFVGGAPQSLGKPVPDIAPIFEKAASDIGSKNFNIPNLPKKHMPKAMPDELLWKYWNVTRNLLALNTDDSSTWPFILGQTAQKLILQAKDAIDPTLAATIVMEAAVPMSKVHPGRVEYAYFKKVK